MRRVGDTFAQREMSDKRKSPPTVAVILTLTVILVGYVLSYAPYIRYRYSIRKRPPRGVLVSYNMDTPYIVENRHTFYAPVEWLVDETPAKRPMLWWADVWDVRDKVSRDAVSRDEGWSDSVQ